MIGIDWADELELEELEATGQGPDSCGEVRVRCQLTARWPSGLKELLARLRIVLVDESGTCPLAVAESALSQHGPSAGGGLLSLGCSVRNRIPSYMDASDLGVRPTVLLYPVQWTQLCDEALPSAGYRRGDSAAAVDNLRVTRWWVSSGSVSGHFVEYEFGACIENRGPETLALGVLRAILEDAKGRVLWTSLFPVEEIGPGEKRVMSDRVSVAGDPGLRGMNRIALSAGAVQKAIVVPLAVWQVENSAGSADGDKGCRKGDSAAGWH